MNRKVFIDRCFFSGERVAENESQGVHWPFCFLQESESQQIIIIIKLYLDTVNSGTPVPFTGVYTH